jgi:uncharacterized protein YciI
MLEHGRISVKSLTEMSRGRGYPAKVVYAMQTDPVGDLTAVVASAPAHLAYWEALDARGRLVLAGPCLPSDGDDWSGSGLVIFAASTREQAEDIAAEDPMHVSGARHYVLTPLLVNHSNFSAIDQT